MRITVGVTDNDWAAYLRTNHDIYEVNFWVPSGGSFQSLAPDEPFLFKTKAPQSQLVGGGFFQRFWDLRVSDAWAAFGRGNGVGTEAELFEVIRRYRERTKRPYEPDPSIGCIVLRNPFFAEPGNELPQPPQWGKSIMTWKNYDEHTPDRDYVEHAFRAMQGGARVDYSWDRDLVNVDLDYESPRYGAPVLTAPRLGQGGFRLAVLQAYDNKCAITGTKVAPTLEAAHIRPYASGGRHLVPNGLSLRSDLHRLYDRGYIAVDTDYRLRVSPRLRSVYGNGDDLYAREDRRDLIAIPQRGEEQPEREALDWHMSEVFLAS